MANARLAEANKTAYQEGSKDGQAGVTQAVRSMLSGVGMKLVPIGSPGAGLMAPPQAMIELPPPPAAAAAGGLVPQQDVAVPPVAPAAGAAGGLVPPQDNQDAPAAAAAGAAAGAAGGLVPRRQRGGAPVADGAAELGEGAAGAANAGTRSGVVSLAATGAQGRRDQRVTGSPASAKGVPVAGSKQYRKVVRMVKMGLAAKPDWLPAGVVWPHLADVLDNKDLLRDYALSACAKPISNIGPQGSSKSSLFKDLSKQHTCGILYTGSRAKDNPLDIRSYLSSCGLWLSLKPVPENLQFCYGYFNFLHSDARAEVFSQLKGCNPADLTDGSYTWDDFCQGVLGSALAGRKETDMQILYDCSSKRSDLKQPRTLQIVGELEVLWSRMQQQPDDVVKIWLVHKAAHPRLKDSIAYTADSTPWTAY
ncbi:hypothetical protein OEZ86_003021 [Tetradesmus obliquus]|nr:hypothetical protein OEZ86_003021 [Tetradesmus obliquus]